jgi:glycosyltransferase involved in cell wall biosynthesis
LGLWEGTMNGPTVSIVTVNRDMADALGPTLESVLAQDYPGFELIVIDGASHDGSQTVIQSYATRLAYWVSEPDRSLYEAMNKGVAAAKGQWVLFMNAGDRFAAPDVLSRIFATNHDGADIVYGHHIRCYPAQGIERLVAAEAPEVLPRRMPCSHQSLLMRRELLLDHPFQDDLLAADYEVLLAAYAAGKTFSMVDRVIARTEMGGRSDTHRLRSLRERMAVLRRHGLMTGRLAWHYRRLMLRAVLARAVKAVLPAPLLRAVLRHRPIRGLG